MDDASFPSASALLRYSIAHAGRLPEPAGELLKHYYRSWGEFRSERMRYWYDFQLTDINALLAKMRSPRLLDAGCGNGTESLWFALNGANVTAVDIDEKLLDVAQHRLEDLRQHSSAPLQCTFSKKKILDVEGKYDLIWLEQAFHHMEPREQVVSKLADLLTPGGYVVFCETNAWNPLLQLQFFKLRRFRTIIRYHGEVWGNERILTAGRLAKHLRSAGLRVTQKNTTASSRPGPVLTECYRLKKAPLAQGLALLHRFCLLTSA